MYTRDYVKKKADVSTAKSSKAAPEVDQIVAAARPGLSSVPREAGLSRTTYAKGEVLRGDESKTAPRRSGGGHDLSFWDTARHDQPTAIRGANVGSNVRSKPGTEAYPKKGKPKSTKSTHRSEAQTVRKDHFVPRDKPSAA